uniref:Integrase zinc-binding domain-containing protein n=1 Tax=Vitis vinifera TaxID=29760 RepID=A5BLZ5_VITVI|nr:hypothetical protein VITISV_043770 [Vitis vinifera]
MPHSIVAPAQVTNDTQARINRIEKRMRLLHVSDVVMNWDGYDDLPVAPLPIEFRMSDIERYTGIRCPRYRADLHCAYHQMAGHDIDNCAALRHAIQDLIDQGLADLGRPSVTIDSFPTHDTRVVPPSPKGVHLIECVGDEIFMMGWDGEAPQLINLYVDLDFIGYTSDQHIPRPFRLTPDGIPRQPSISLVYLQHMPPMTPFILFPEGYRPTHRDVQIVTRSGRSILASSSMHKDALVRALNLIKIDASTTLKGLIHILTTNRATCIMLSNDNLPLKGSDHVRPLYINVACSSHRVPSVLLDNDFALNVYPLATTIALSFFPYDFGPSTQTIRAYDGTQRTVMGTLTAHVMIGLVRYFVLFQVFRIQSSFNLLLGRLGFMRLAPYYIPFTKRDVITSSKLMLRISHSDDDLHLTGFKFGEVQVVNLEDDNRDMVPMSFDQYNNTLGFDVVIVTPSSSDWANMFSICFPNEVFDYGLLMDSRGGTDGVTLDDAYTDEMDMIGIGCILDAAPHGLHFAFDLFGVSMLESDGDDFITNVATHDFTSIEGVSNPVDPLFYFDSMSRFVTRYDASTAQIHDIDDVGNPNGPPSGQLDCDSDSEERKVTLVSGNTKSVDFGTSDQPRELKIGSSLSLNESSRLINLLRSYLDVKPFGLKNAGATYQKVATTLFHDMMHKDVEVYVDDMIVKSRDREDHLKCTFGVTSGKFLGHIVNEHGIEVDPENIRVILDMPAPRTERDKIKECLISPPVLVPPTPRHPLLLYLSVSDMALGCMLTQLDDLKKERAIYYLKFDIQYVTQKSVKGSIITNHLASLSVVDDRLIDDDFPNEQFVSVASINQFVDALATLASMIEIPVEMTMQPLLIETRSAPANYCLIGNIEDQVELPWYQFLAYGVYPKSAMAKDRRALRQLATRFIICGNVLYRRSSDSMLLLCIDQATTNRVIREVHAGVYRPHMGGHMLSLKIMRTGYFWLTMEIDCYQFVQRCPECQMHGDLIHVTSYASLTVAKVAKFIISHIICQYGIPHELISNRGVRFKEKLSFALWAYHTSFRTSIGATPFLLVYGMEVALPIEIEVGSLRIDLEHQITEIDWLRARYGQLNLIDEKRLRATDHMHAYQKKMVRSFRKRVKPRKFQKCDLVLRVLRELISDPRGKFKPSRSGPYVIRELTLEGAA